MTLNLIEYDKGWKKENKMNIELKPINENTRNDCIKLKVTEALWCIRRRNNGVKC